MAYTEFCCRSGGSNLNAGTLTGNSTEPGTGATLTYASGNWVQATRVFTVASGDPVADGVAVGDFASVYADGSTVTGFVGRVTARTSTTITISATAISGTAPTDGTGNRTLKLGGAWLGPNAASGFPFNFITAAMTNVAANAPRVNFKNAATYSITAATTHTLIGPTTFQGYTTSYGDLGRGIIDGGTSGASYVLGTFSGSGGAFINLLDLIWQNNGATGSAGGLVCNDSRTKVQRVVVNNVRGAGFSGIARAIECEAYACNQSNTANLGGFTLTDNAMLVRCISHDNAGSNNNGFYLQVAGCSYINCIADSNGLHGFHSNNIGTLTVLACDAYNNGGDGWRQDSAPITCHIESSNFIKNGGYGINMNGGAIPIGQMLNCGFGAGTEANASGATNNAGPFNQSGTVTYASNVTPWVDPVNGDFRVTLSTAKGTGRGAFTQTAASYAGAVGYPDIGAAQHQDSGGSGGGLKLAGAGGLAG